MQQSRPRSVHLRSRLIVGPEELARQRHEFGVARMIQRLDRRYSFGEIGPMLGDIVLQLQLGVGGYPCRSAN
jgi:hypothetical protein